MGASCLSAPFLYLSSDLGTLYPQVESFVSIYVVPFQSIRVLFIDTRTDSSAFLGRVISLPSSSITLPKWGNVLTLSWELFSSSSRSLYASSNTSLPPLHLFVACHSSATIDPIHHLFQPVDSQANRALCHQHLGPASLYSGGPG